MPCITTLHSEELTSLVWVNTLILGSTQNLFSFNECNEPNPNDKTHTLSLLLLPIHTLSPSTLFPYNLSHNQVIESRKAWSQTVGFQTSEWTVRRVAKTSGCSVFFCCLIRTSYFHLFVEIIINFLLCINRKITPSWQSWWVKKYWDYLWLSLLRLVL